MLLLVACLALAAAFLWWKWQQGARKRQMVNKFPGPRSYPLLGNALELGWTTADFLVNVERLSKKYNNKPYRLWIGPSNVFVFLTDPKDMEIILGSNKIIDKGDFYKFFHPWLGTGLLTSTGDKWRRSRKILTPTFHFKILEQFIDGFNANGKILVDQLKQQLDGPGFDIHKYITLYALDNICETAMGVKINAQKVDSSEYIEAIRDQSDVLMLRAFKPWMTVDFIFNLTKYKKIHQRSLEVLHSFTKGVIKQRKEEILKEKALKKATGEEVVDESDGVKKRLAFLDLLIESTYEGSLLTDENIREEVDTFMFEGHDTTASGISFTLWLLAWNQDVQEKVLQELHEAYPDPDEEVSFRGLQELKYLDRVLKEAQRVYPSVPMFARRLVEDVALSDGQIAPTGCAIAIIPYTAHHNPDVWPDPLKFDPDRFLPENSVGRNPYAFVPFSAGPRNCIGQKFAMLEMKSCIAHVLREYKVLPGTEKPELHLAAELIMISETGIPITIVKRRS